MSLLKRKNLSPLIVALDVDDIGRARRLVDELSEVVDIFKVGPILYLKYGTQIVDMINSFGKKVFLDLKFNDIPNTVANAVNVARAMGVYMLTIHATSGPEAIAKAKDLAGDVRILCVTVLTSLDDALLKRLGFCFGSADMVKILAQIAVESGADGIVCSPREIGIVRDICGKDRILVTPGVRLTYSTEDQKRVATPKFAMDEGANFIVVGREIYNSDDPLKAAINILDSIS